MNSKSSQIQVLNLNINVFKKDIKNMHLRVTPQGEVCISAPKDLNDEAIRLFALSKAKWIKKHLKNFKDQPREQPREYINGESHYFNGKRYLLEVVERYGKHEVVVKNKTYLTLYVRPNTTIEGRKKVFDKFYRDFLNEVLNEIISKWETKIGVKSNTYILLKMKTKWGSCNIEKKKIILNPELAKKPRYCLEYVVVHELIHLLERNHNDRFISLLDQFMPNWKTYRRDLNALPITIE